MGVRRALVLALLALSLSGYAKTRYTLHYPIPNGFRLGFHVKKATSRLKEYVPVDESMGRWTRMLTVQEFSGISEKVKPEQYLKKFFELAEPRCDDFRYRLYPKRPEGGFEVALGLQYCGKFKKTQQGEVTLIKVIRGDEYVHVVQMAWRGTAFGRREDPLSKNEMTDWMQLMRQVRLIDIEDEIEVKVLHSTIQSN